MFLNKLEDNEKVAFLTLAHHIARSDGDFSENEQNVIATYCMEMQIEDINYNEDSFNLTKILSEIKSDENQKILNIIIEHYNISEALSIVYSEWSKSILSISNQAQALIKL
jgi:tellurite resistance protein